ncbi:alpha/beta fold hydrolase [Flavobacterium wongokense]|uniref:alpha/beta fold hydrolase n=1 Tax=Flavobacterium wongokense TaxID=2910674 RepID=UPI001F3AE84B|nr:alpha/beta fold hydrolase [Flavobacterium sp. WG47]MCF6133192.1 alpha/beta hydrolase [Flavobacterium sp. WG47]
MQKIQFFIITKSIGMYLNLLSYINLESAKSKAYQLFTSPRKGKLNKAELPKILQTATLETFEYNKEVIQTYVWKGNEDIILLVHGWESNASRWKKLLHHLKPLGKTIIAIDGPAHGLSGGSEFSTPKYAEFLNVVIKKYQPKILIGHSVGGAAISFYLNKYKPEAKPNGAEPNPAIEKIILLGAPSDFKIVSNNFVKLLSLNDRIKLRLEDYFIQRFEISLDDFAGHKFAQSFAQKALIAHDREDNVVLVDEGRKYASAWKNAIYIETNGLGHSMHDAGLYQQIINFI